MAKLVKFKLNGKDVEAPEGQLVIDAAKDQGVEVPHYCYHPGLGNPGVCRLCVCEVAGAPKPQMTCRTAVKEGLDVKTDSPVAKRAQASSLEFHLANHPLDCPVCDQAGECHLQDYYQRFGLYKSTVREDKRHKEKRKDIGTWVMLDQERCIQCTRCTRFVDNVTKTHELAVFGRGDRSVLDLYPGMRLDNPYSGNVVDICPVGALTDKDFRFSVRAWYLDRTPSVCTGCARGCSVEVHTNTKRPWHTGGRRVARLKPRYNPEVNGWWMCDEGRYGYKSADAKTRVKGSSVLGTDGQPAQLTPADAAARVAKELRELCADNGPEGLAFLVSASLTNEDLFALKALMKRLGVPLSNAVLAPGADQLGEEDALLRRKEKVANLSGAAALGFGVTKGPEALKGKVWGAWTVGRAGHGSWIGLPFTLWQGANAVRGSDTARWVLAGAHWTETDGTVVNFSGRVQRLRAAVPPLGESAPAWAWFGSVLRALGGAFPHDDAGSVFAALSAAEPAFAGLKFELPKDGVLLPKGRPEAATA
ncbi:2Fe-2S iron-sulfur cluster binding domain-containing protein [bacterium]|nr:MAG: 2Fe-2S iron-sulfur cluster binding domain-containing protein [bacterium]